VVGAVGFGRLNLNHLVVSDLAKLGAWHFQNLPPEDLGRSLPPEKVGLGPHGKRAIVP